MVIAQKIVFGDSECCPDPRSCAARHLDWTLRHRKMLKGAAGTGGKEYGAGYLGVEIAGLLSTRTGSRVCVQMGYLEVPRYYRYLAFRHRSNMGSRHRRCGCANGMHDVTAFMPGDSE